MRLDGESYWSLVVYPHYLSALPPSSRKYKKGLALASLLSTVNPSSQAFAEEEPTPASSSIDAIVVAGATGQTGSRIYNRLLAQSSITVKGGVRNVDKAAKSSPKGSTLSHLLDVVEDSLADLTQTLQGSNGLVMLQKWLVDVRYEG